jgi:aerobic-type carbon monoxide dehydrogenase small subunit (CoxS/CutS family)
MNPIGMGKAVEQIIQFRLNQKPVRLTLDGDRMLLWVLRTELGLTGTKYGCGQSFCGACTVLVNKEPVRSCQFPIKDVQGKEILTIEGLSRDGKLHPLQKAFLELDAYQCGFCTPGMILTAYAFLLKNSKPTPAAIIEAMDQNLCRCGSYTRIVGAVQKASAEMKGGNAQ